MAHALRPVIHAGQVADLANMFYRSYQEDPKALTKEAIERCAPHTISSSLLLLSGVGVLVDVFALAVAVLVLGVSGCVAKS